MADTSNRFDILSQAMELTLEGNELENARNLSHSANMASHDHSYMNTTSAPSQMINENIKQSSIDVEQRNVSLNCSQIIGSAAVIATPMINSNPITTTTASLSYSIASTQSTGSIMSCPYPIDGIYRNNNTQYRDSFNPQFQNSYSLQYQNSYNPQFQNSYNQQFQNSYNQQLPSSYYPQSQNNYMRMPMTSHPIFAMQQERVPNFQIHQVPNMLGYQIKDPTYEPQQSATGINQPDPIIPPPMPSRATGSPITYSKVLQSAKPAVRTPGSGGRPPQRRQRTPDDEQAINQLKRPKLSTVQSEVPPLVIEGNLTGFKTYESINAEFDKLVHKDRILRIKPTARGKILMYAKTEDDRKYLFSHYPKNELFNGQSVIREARSYVTYDYSAVLMDVPLSTSVEEIERLLKKSNVPVIGVQRLRNREKQETTSVRIGLPDETTTKNLISEGVKFDMISIRIKEYVPPAPRITQCYRCQGYNHIAVNCHSSLKCLKCGRCHRSADCTYNDFYCVNCGGAHTTVDRSCIARIAEIENRKKDKPNELNIANSMQQRRTPFRRIHSRTSNSPKQPGFWSPSRQNRPNPVMRNNLTANIPQLVSKCQHPTLKEHFENEPDTILSLLILLVFGVTKMKDDENVNELSKAFVKIGNACNLDFNVLKVTEILKRITENMSDETSNDE